MDLEKGLRFTAIYKASASFLRILFAAIIIYLGSLHKFLFLLFGKEVLEDPNDFLFNLLTLHIKDVPRTMVFLFAMFLIVYSLFELICSVGVLYKKRFAAEGLIFVLVVGIFFDLFFVSKILILSKFIGILVDLLIIWFLLDVLIKHKKMLKK